MDESYGKLNNLAAIGVNAKEQLEPTKVSELNVRLLCNVRALHLEGARFEYHPSS